jgi:hypothetical protein
MMTTEAMRKRSERIRRARVATGRARREEAILEISSSAQWCGRSSELLQSTVVI